MISGNALALVESALIQEVERYDGRRKPGRSALKKKVGILGEGIGGAGHILELIN